MVYRLRKKAAWFLKARHWHGHGIHSPFLFRLITRVIENRGNFTAYRTLAEADSAVSGMLRIMEPGRHGHFGPSGGMQEVCTLKRSCRLPLKHDLLLFRLVNEFRPAATAFYGSTFGTTLLALALADSRIPVRAQISNNQLRTFCRRLADIFEPGNLQILEFLGFEPAGFVVIQEPADAVFCDKILCAALADPDFEGVVAVCGIHHSREMEQVWSIHEKRENVRISLDLFETGLLICRKGLQKQSFVLRF